MNIYDLSHWTVLAVDDEPDSLEVLAEVLDMSDATVQTANGGGDALRQLATLRPTLIITDISMPEIDGYSLLRKLRKIEGLADTPVIALTAHAMKGDRELIMRAGFNGYLTKPLRIDTMLDLLFEQLPDLKPVMS
ncbi:MAG: response regulator [Anaerolineae bacterium]|nr:response regulator [Anaerolineae bacterium]